MHFGPPQHILGEAPLAYNPTDEWIFPSVISSAGFTDPLAKWYLYYSPHDAPGGICLALADDLSGPWREYEGNPLIGKDWAPHYAVSHVASPHPLWMPEANRLFLWFHGENGTTRYATSTDGIHFSYEGVAISSADKPELTELSYARVFRNPDPSIAGDGFFMLYMGRLGDQRFIYVARSADARNWVLDKDPLIKPPEEIGQNTSGPWLTTLQGTRVVCHHIDRFVGDPTSFDLSGDFFATPVSADLTRSLETKLLYQADPALPDDARVADFQLVSDGEETWMFYIGGRRLKGRIYARKMAFA